MTEAVRYLKIPTAQTERRSSNGYCNGFHRFVPNFAHIRSLLAARLHKLQVKDLARLNGEELTALGIVQEKLICLLVLSLPGKKGDTLSTRMHVIAKHVAYCCSRSNRTI